MGRDHRKRHKHICLVCGREFMGTSTATYCSIGCRNQAYIIRHGFNYTEVEWNSLREFILERDNYTCQDCGKFMMDIGFHVHHIKLLRKGGTNDGENLITLCISCHRKKHGLTKENVPDWF